MTVRAIQTACTVPGSQAPFDTAHVKVFYPAAPTGDMAERMSGVVAADASLAPYPVVLFAHGVNVGAEAYRWLAEDLAARGYAVVTWSLVQEIFGTGVGNSPGLDVSLLRPETFGSGPSGTALQAILDAVATIGGPLEGLLDLDRVVLGGHSGGATMVLHSADPAWFPTVRGVFSYGAHTMTSTMLGWEPGHVMDLCDDLPVLLLAGESDGVMAASAVRYGEENQTDRVDPIARSFDGSYAGGRGDVFHVVVKNANHFTVAHPLDTTSARSFLDTPPDGDEGAARALIAQAITSFCDAVTGRGTFDTLQSWTTAPPAGVLSARSK